MCSGQYSFRCYLIVFLSVDMAFTIVRQVFDFLGRLWLPILLNFVHTLCLIFGIFGALQLRPSFLVVFLMWAAPWFAWNGFLICYYLNIGSLSREDSLLSFYHGGPNWWYGRTGCSFSYNQSLSKNVVTGCAFGYWYIEVVQSSVQCLLTFACVVLGSVFLISFVKKLGGSVVRRADQPRVTMELLQADVVPPGNAKLSQNGGHLTMDTGYLNISEDGTTRTGVNGYLDGGIEGGSQQRVPRNYRRSSRDSSSKKKSSSSTTHSGRSLEIELVGPVISTSGRAHSLDRQEQRRRTKERHRRHSYHARERRRNRQTNEPEVQSASRMSSSSETRTLASHITLTPSPSIENYQHASLRHLREDKRSSANSFRPSNNSLAKKNFTHYPTPGIAKLRQVSGSESSDIVSHDPNGNHDNNRNSDNFGDETNLVRSISGATLESGNDAVSDFSKATVFPPNESDEFNPPTVPPTPSLTSFITFDPKSNTLIRYHQKDQEFLQPTSAVNPTIPVRYANSSVSNGVPSGRHPQGLLFNQGGDRVSYDSGIVSAISYTPSSLASDFSHCQATSIPSAAFRPPQPSFTAPSEQVEYVTSLNENAFPTAPPPLQSFVPPAIGRIRHDFARATQNPSALPLYKPYSRPAPPPPPPYHGPGADHRLEGASAESNGTFPPGQFCNAQSQNGPHLGSMIV